MKKIASLLTIAAALAAGVSLVSCSSSGGDKDVIKAYCYRENTNPKTAVEHGVGQYEPEN